MYINNLLRKKGLKLYKKIFRILFDSFFFMDPLLNTRQPQISTEKNQSKPYDGLLMVFCWFVESYGF